MIVFIKRIAKKLPYAKRILIFLKDFLFRRRIVAKRFEHIYKHNAWVGISSVSGRGSDFDQAETIIMELPLLFEEFHVTSILDIPCGDFNWMRKINLKNYRYTGAASNSRISIATTTVQPYQLWKTLPSGSAFVFKINQDYLKAASGSKNARAFSGMAFEKKSFL